MTYNENRPRRYQQPKHWERVAVAELLAGSPRGKPAQEQLSLLTSAAKSIDGQAMVFVAGDTSLLRRRCIAVVGARKVTPEGAARARRLAKELVHRGVVVVSGLAEGVDREAMTAAIKEGGKTIGVIGTPLDQAYPASNKALQEQVYREHLLISEYDFGSRVFKSNFPQRNRLMAMLSDATVVIEASDTSGSLHQAAECVRLDRWLFVARSVVENKDLTWPARFTSYGKCRVLDSTQDIIELVYNGT